MIDGRKERQFHLVNKIVGLLKACAKQKDVGKGSKLHLYILEHEFLEENCYIGSALVSMYARCGALTKAQHVLQKLPMRNAVTWNAMIGGYAQQGKGMEALKCFDNMQQEGHSPDVVTFICALKACGNMGATAKGEEMHDKIVSLGMLEREIALGNTLVDMYARSGALAKAQQVLRELPVRNTVTWNALIAGYVQQRCSQEALKCFDNMQQEGHSPDSVSFICALKACGSIRAIAKGERMHDKLISLGMLEKDIVLGNTLVDMYAKCGAFGKAQQVLDALPIRNVVTWTALIAGYTHQGQGEEAMKCFDYMEQEGHFPNVVTFICALKACGCMQVAVKGKSIHDKVVSLGMLEKNMELGNSLVDMYARCGVLAKAQEVLSELPIRSVIMWTALIAGYMQQGKNEEALECFDSMQHDGHSPDVLAFACALKACGSVGAAAKGEKLHEDIVSLGLLEKDVVLGTVLVDMYARFGALAKAKNVLDELPFRDEITWSSLITGYAQWGQGKEALQCLDSMECEGYIPDAVTFISALNACWSIGATVMGEKIHEKILGLGMLEKDIVLGNTLLDMYARCGVLVKAQQVLERLPVRDVITWTTLVTGYVEQDLGEEALKCFDSMKHEGHSPNGATFIIALKACGSLGAVTKGKLIHDEIISLGLLEKDIVLGNALVGMYAKCAALEQAIEVLEGLPVHDVISWNALIGGYAQQGHFAESLNCLERMQFKGVNADSTTLVFLLTACSHSGLVGDAEMYFSRLTSYGTMPDVEHFCCMVDLFGRAGKFKAALSIIEKMPYGNYLPVWLSLLGACRKWEM